MGYLKVILAPVLLPCPMSNLKQLLMRQSVGPVIQKWNLWPLGGGSAAFAAGVIPILLHELTLVPVAAADGPKVEPEVSRPGLSGDSADAVPLAQRVPARPLLHPLLVVLVPA